MALSYNSNATMQVCLNIDKAAPIDNRTVVDAVTDLTTFSKPYVGMVVAIKGTSDVYVLIGSGPKAKDLNYWKKIGGSDFDEDAHLSDYQAKLGARILDSADDLVKVTFAYIGMFAYVKNDASETSEDESGLYILTDSDATNPDNWVHVMGSSSGSSSSNTDASSVINTDSNTAPSSGSGISVSTQDSNDTVAVYVDDDETGFIANTYYTSKGINADTSNDGSDDDQSLAGYDAVILQNGGLSFIRLNRPNSGEDDTYENWITIHIDKDENTEDTTTLGFITSDITYLDADDVAQTDWETTADGDFELSLKYEREITCSKNVKFNGWTEQRVKGITFEEDLIFGDTGSRYYDLDIYTVNVLPKVYAYVNNTQVQVLTEVDKEEILTTITNTVEPDSISEAEIQDLFDAESGTTE